MEPIRPATPEEIEKVKAVSDITPNSNVIAFDQGEGKEPMLAVLRQVYEVDPVFYNGAPDNRKAVFIWGLENVLRFLGVSEYYFNIPVADEHYKAVVEHWGAETTSREPELRFKKRL